MSVLVPPNENELAVVAGVSKETALLLFVALGTLASLVVFVTVAAPNPNDICDFSVLPKNDFDAMEFIDDDDEGGANGCCCVTADLVIVNVAGFSSTPFGLNGVVVLVTGCGRTDNCVG